MPDMLCSLYEYKPDYTLYKQLEENGVVVRQALGAERTSVLDFIQTHFSEAWVGEASIALSNMPVSCYIAIKDHKILGFSCYDAGRKGMFGPIGVCPDARGLKLGKALLQETLLAMRYNGYPYAIIGYVGPAEFYEKLCGAKIIEGEDPPPEYRNFVKPRTDK